MKINKRLSEGELEIMQIIWKETPPVSRSTIEDVLLQNKEVAPTTILTFLTRLCEKGFLTLEKKGRTNLYTPLICERDYLSAESRHILDKLYGGSLQAFAASLCDSGIKKEEIEALKEMLERGTL